MYCTSNTSVLRLDLFSVGIHCKFHWFCVIEYFVSRAHCFDFSLHSPLALVAPLTSYVNPTFLFGFEMTESLYTLHHTFMFCSNIHVCSTLFCEKISISRDYIVEWGTRNSAFGLRAGCGGFESWQGQDTFFSKTSTPALGRNQLPIQWVPRAFSPGGKAGGS